MESTVFRHILIELNAQIDLAEYMKCTELSEELRLRRNNLYAIYLKSPKNLSNSKMTGKPEIYPIKVTKSIFKDEIYKFTAM